MRRATVGVSAISLAVGCLVGCTPLAPPPPISPFGLLTPGAAPPEPVKETRTVTDVQLNVCNGETVHLTGELREDTKVKDSKVDQHIKANLTGSGNLGNEYKFELDVKSKWDTASMTMTLKDRELLASKGPSPDQRVTVTISSSPLSLKIEAECH